MEQTKKKVSPAVLVLYSVLFYGCWTVFELYIKGRILPHNEIAAQILRSGVIKNLVWTLPAALLIYRYREAVQIRLKEMFTSRIPVSTLLIPFAVFTAFLLASAFRTHGKLAIRDSFGVPDIVIVLFVGITEEIVFRGWLLNATAEKDDDWLALGINAVMFLCIHFPRWIHDGVFVQSFAGFGFVEIMILSVIFGRAFLRSRNLLVPVLLHMYWDLFIFMFI